MSLHTLFYSSYFSSHHPSTPSFWSSEMPKDSDPMKSLRLVRSQSHTSTDRRRSLSYSFRWLRDREGQTTVGWWLRVITVGAVIVKGLNLKDTWEQCWIDSFSSSTFIPRIIPLIRYQESFPSFFCTYFFLPFRHTDRNDSISEWTSALPR